MSIQNSLLRRATLLKTVKVVTTYNYKTVGEIDHRYRLVQQWVSEMTLNVQSEFIHLIESRALGNTYLVLKYRAYIYI